MTDQMLVLEGNTSEVMTQLKQQDQSIVDRLNERRVKSLHKSINNSFSRPLQIHCSPLGKSRVRHLTDDSILGTLIIDEIPARIDLPVIQESSAVAHERIED